MFVDGSKPSLTADVLGLLPTSGRNAKGTGSISQSIRTPPILHRSLPSVKPIFSKVKKKAINFSAGLKPEQNQVGHHMCNGGMRNLTSNFLLCHTTWCIPYNSFPYKLLSHEDTVIIYPTTMRRLGFVTAINLTVPDTLGNKAIGRVLSKTEKTPW